MIQLNLDQIQELNQFLEMFALELNREDLKKVIKPKSGLTMIKRLEVEADTEETWVEKTETRLINERAYNYNKKKGEFWAFKECQHDVCISSKAMRLEAIRKIENIVFKHLGEQLLAVRIKADSKDLIVFPTPRKGAGKVVINLTDFKNLTEFNAFFEELVKRSEKVAKPINQPIN